MSDEVSLFADLENAPLDLAAPYVREPAPPEAPPPPRPSGIFTGMLWDRVHLHGKNAVVVVTGESGSGKSWASLSLCHAVDPQFNKDGVYFRPEKLLAETNSDAKRRGRARLFDEAGVGVHNRNWSAEVNKTLIHFMQTWRVWGEVLVLTVPRLGFLDSQVLKQCQYWVEMSSTHRGLGKVKSIWLKEELRGKPMWFPYLRTTLPGGRVVQVRAARFAPPPARLADWYEAESRRFKFELQASLHANLEESRRKQTTIDVDAVAEEIVKKMRNVDGLYRRDLKKGGQKLDRGTIMAEYKLPANKAQQVFALVLREFPSL